MTRNKFIDVVKEYLLNFCRQSTIHGLDIVSLPRIHIFERIFWLLIITTATFGSISLTLSNWNRFLANPTVVSIQKDFRKWENMFPAATGCFHDKMDLKKAEKYIYRQWGIKSSDARFEYYLNFTKTVSNVNYHNLHSFAGFESDETLKKADMLALAFEVHPTLTGTLVTVERNHKPKWELILTELGVCFTINSKFSNILAFKSNLDNKNISKRSIYKCHYLNGLCYARYDSDPQRPLQYYIHSPLDVAHINSNSYHEVHTSEELEINYKMMETNASPNIRYLSPSQRGCRFDDEPLKNGLPVYSTSLCYIVCRYELAIRLCGCKPFFYHFLVGKTCDIKGLICLSKYVSVITQAPANIGCKCPQPCNLVSYLPQNPKYTKWDQGGYLDQRITFRWGLLHPTTKYKRDILFGFADLVVSLGGTLNLFLGISFITLIETMYLVIEGLIISRKKYKNTRPVFTKRNKKKYIKKTQVSCISQPRRT